MPAFPAAMLDPANIEKSLDNVNTVVGIDQDGAKSFI
jgi:hypothetical protein